MKFIYLFSSFILLHLNSSI